jgi:putative peptide zinc metalloprotease protein
VRQVAEGKASYVVKDPARLTYFRFGEAEVWLMQRMDGTRPIRRLVDEAEAALGARIPPDTLETFVRRLKELGLVERSNEEKRAVLLEVLRRDRKLRLKGHGSTILRMRFSLGDPDRAFAAIARALPLVWTPAFVAFSAAAFLAYAAIITAQWDVFSNGLSTLYTPAFYTPTMVLTIWVSLAVITAIHEVGHGVTCRHFGGEVHEIGAMLIYFMPAAYCNVNDAWTFEKRSHRLWVTFAGGWVQLLIACAAAFVWLLTDPATFPHHLAFVVMLLSGGTIILINFNPLIPLDGYYALMDWLEIPNLRSRAFAYLRARVKRVVLRMDTEVPGTTAREARIFLVYSVLAVIYICLLLSGLALLAAGFLIEHFGGWGWVIIGVFAAGPAGRLVGRSKRHVRVWWSDRLPAARAGKLLYGGGAAVLLVGIAAFIVPWPVIARGSAQVEPARRLWLRAPQDAIVESVSAAEGQVVPAGAVVAVLRSPELELQLANASAAKAELEREIAMHRARGRATDARFAELRLDYARQRLNELDRLRDRLILRAPFDARVVTPHTRELAGAGLERGDSVLELWSTGPLRLRLLLPQRNAGGVREGAAAFVRLAANSGRTLRTSVEHVSAGARAGHVELLAPIPGTYSATAPAGMTGRAKVVIGRTSVAAAIGRAVRRSIRVDFLL